MQSPRTSLLAAAVMSQALAPAAEASVPAPALHTPGLLEVDETGEYIQQVGATDLGVASVMNLDVGGEKGWYRGPITQANASRLVACWNSCDGVPTDMLEQVPGLGKATLPYRTMRAHFDHLLLDLKEAAATLRRYEALHRAKGTPESDAKAEVNATLAARFEATIASAGSAS